MNKIILYLLIVVPMLSLSCQDKKTDAGSAETAAPNIQDIAVKDMSGNDVKLADYDGTVLLIVNVASECGYTPQYEGLQAIYDKYNEQGFEILAFPCNDFGGQEPGTNEEIQQFCSSKFGVTFKLFDKVKVLGDEKAPLYKVLTDNSATGSSDINWNFEKFLISKDGNIVKRYLSKVKPESEELTGDIEAQLSM